MTETINAWTSLLVAVCLIALCGTAGCMVGPDYKTPRAEVSEGWIDVKSSGRGSARHNAQWWDTFNDATLTTLINQALSRNLTLREAGLRVIQARAQRGISVGEFFPQSQIATGNASLNRVSANSPQGIGSRRFKDYSVGLEAVWELDFWGRFRRGIESADAALDASVADYDAVLVALVADVASDYVQIRSLQEQLEFTSANVKAQQDTLELTRIRFNAGAVSELDVATAQATLSNTQSLIPQLEDSLRRTTVALCVLLGQTPSTLERELAGAKSVPAPPAELALGVPADLLLRRPDVRRSERTAAALSAQIGVAKADLFPAVSIKGLTGFHTSTAHLPGRSPVFHNLLDAASFEGFIGLDVNWPILNYGRIQNNIRVNDAQFQEAVEAFRNTVLQAAADVESALSSFLRNREQAAYLSESVTAAQRTVDLSLIQYRRGAVDFLRVNQAQVDLVERQNSFVVARAGVAQGAIETYRALGGGWETRIGKEFIPSQTVEEMRRRTDWGDILSPDYGKGADFGLFPRPADKPRSTSGQEQEASHGH